MRYTEISAAQVLGDAVDRKSFNSVMFAQELYTNPKATHNPTMGAFLAFVDVLARAGDKGHYDIENQESIFLAIHLRDKLTERYGYWPVHLEEV